MEIKALITRSKTKRAIFLDRDGVLIYDSGHLHKKSQVKLLAGIKELAWFQKEGFLLIIFSNQSAVARRMLTEEQMWGIDRFIRDELEKRGVKITASYYCPHHPEFTGECECRKPNPGMVRQAIADFDIDPRESVVIGDKMGDLEAGKKTSIEIGILVKRNGENWDVSIKKSDLESMEHKAENISQAAGIIKENL